jgi:ADP-ribosyl-[dinitrogen reductase] hydrolase
MPWRARRDEWPVQCVISWKKAVFPKKQSDESNIPSNHKIYLYSWINISTKGKSMDLIDRYRGCMLGLATGDALGTTLEFEQPGNIEPVHDMVGGGPFNLEPGQWTDDTSLALCLAESLIVKKEFDPRDQLERYCRWFMEGYLSSNGTCFDIGMTTRKALQQFMLSHEPYPGQTNPRSASNGSLMRLAPVPLFYASNPSLAI